MSDETELQRAIERLTATIEKLEARVVLQVQYTADKEAAADHRRFLTDKVDSLAADVKEDLGALERKVDADINDRKADRRLILAAFLAFVASVIMQIYERSQGVS